MKVELLDDRIAQWVYKNAPIEDKAHALAGQFIQERYRHYCASKNLLLTRHELAFIRPHLHALDLNAEQAAFVKRSQERVRQKQRRYQIKNMAMVALLVGFVFSFWGLWERQRFTHASDDLAQAQDSIGKLWQAVYRERSAQPIDPPPMAAALPAFKAVMIHGTVQDANGMPIPNATVHLLGAHVQSNTEGYYQLQLVYPPQQTEPRPALTIYKEPYQPLTQSVRLERDTVEAHAILLPQ